VVKSHFEEEINHCLALIIMQKCIEKRRKILKKVILALKEKKYNSKVLSEITGYDTVISKNVGEGFSAINGAVIGQNLHLLPGKMIVQSWRWITSKRDVSDSVLVLVFSELNKGETPGTRVEMSNANIPNEEMPFINKDTYMDSLIEYIQRAVEEEKSKKEAQEETVRQKAEMKKEKEMAAKKQDSKVSQRKAPAKSAAKTTAKKKSAKKTVAKA
jgi:hypothetical protein